MRTRAFSRSILASAFFIMALSSPKMCPVQASLNVKKSPSHEPLHTSRKSNVQAYNSAAPGGACGGVSCASEDPGSSLGLLRMMQLATQRPAVAYRSQFPFHTVESQVYPCQPSDSPVSENEMSVRMAGCTWNPDWLFESMIRFAQIRTVTRCNLLVDSIDHARVHSHDLPSS